LPFSGVVPNVIEDHVRGNGRLDRTLQTHLHLRIERQAKCEGLSNLNSLLARPQWHLGRTRRLDVAIP